MWVLIFLYGILLPILMLGVFVAGVIGAIALLRRRTTGDGVSFASLLYAYLGLMLLVGAFLIASGGSLVIRAGIGEGISRDFAYAEHRPWDYEGRSYELDSDGRSDAVDGDIEDDIEDDIVWGVALVVVGGGMFMPHGLGLAYLRRRRVAGYEPVARGLNLIALAAATIGFLSAGGTALTQVLLRFADDTPNGWKDHHPGEPLALALVLFPLAAWYAYLLLREIDQTADGA